jgi:hypothetical protein
MREGTHAAWLGDLSALHHAVLGGPGSFWARENKTASKQAVITACFRWENRGKNRGVNLIAERSEGDGE